MSAKLKNDQKDLEQFLKKVDDVGSIIQELTTSDDTVKEAALHKADEYLNKVNDQKPNAGFNRTEINKIEDVTSDSAYKPEISAEDFMKEIEEDSRKRTEKRKVKKEKALVWKEKGNVVFKEGRYADAVENYSEAIRLIPDDEIFYCNRAQALIKMEEYETALKDCESAIKLKKDFVKAYVHQGRALTGLKRYNEAVSSFNYVLKIDKKQQNVINDYINEAEKQKQLDLEEEKASALLKEGDTSLQEIKSLVTSLRKGYPPDIWKGNDVIVKLKSILLEEIHRIMFRTSKGFSIFIEHPAFTKLMKKTSYSPEEMNVLVNIVSLLSNAIKDSEENCTIVCSMNHVLDACIACLKNGKGLKEEFEAVQFFHSISQFNGPRKMLLSNASIALLLNETLAILGKGGDLALVAMGMINNLALDASFVPKFEMKLTTDFIPGVQKMMELLSISFPDIAAAKTFLPVMASSISTIGNLFHNADLRKKRADCDQNMWDVSYQLLCKYSAELVDNGMLKVVHATLGMLMNLSTQKIVFKKEFAKNWVDLSSKLMNSVDSIVVERCCGILNHTLGHNEAMLDEIIVKKIYLQFIKIIKGDNEGAKRFTIKCIALCSNNDNGVRENISKRAVFLSLLQCLDSADELVIGNTSLIFAHCHGSKLFVTEVINNGVIKKLLTHATNDHLSKTVRHNCAVAIGKYCLADQRCLQQLRDLHGLEILHEVMKENKLV